MPKKISVFLAGLGLLAAPPAGALLSEVLDPVLASLYNGHWYVNQVRCGDEAPNDSTRSMYTGRNSISVEIQNLSGAFIDDINGCQTRIPLALSYPQEDTIVGQFSGAVQCQPAACSPICGLEIPATVTYQYDRRLTTLRWQSVGESDDNCTKNGQPNPIQYTMRRKVLGILGGG